MSFRSGALRLLTVALLFCIVWAVSDGIHAQSQQAPTTPAVPVAPPAPVAPPKPATPTAPSSHPAQQPTPPAQPAVPVKVAAPVSPITHASLNERMSLGDGRQMWHPTRRLIGLTLSAPNSAGVVTSYDFNADKARYYLTRIAPYVTRTPVPAHIELAPPHANSNPLAETSSSLPIPATIVPAEPGAKLDIDGSVAAIQKAVAAKPTVHHIVLALKYSPITNTAPKFKGINARIAHFVTHFNPYEKGRTQTVRKAIDLIDNHFVAPGAIFSVNQTVGERTANRGFGEGIVFVDGHLDTQLGGGMCQVATTLFNAVLLADLKIVERHQHVRTVPYVKPGQDATVYWGQKDFKFQNDTKTPIYISYKTTATHAICDLYGRADTAVKVTIDDNYQRLGPRHYTAVLQRYVRENGKTKMNFETKSSYKWTPKLDYTF